MMPTETWPLYRECTVKAVFWLVFDSGMQGNEQLFLLMREALLYYTEQLLLKCN